MSYQVIARKYRPQRFADVVGQEHVTRTLSNAIAQNRIAHAYLFCGPRGTGKTTIARIFAKCLNATNGPTVEFADDDPRCVEIAEGRSLDVLEIDAASNRGIDEIRGLRETVKYAPAQARFKIYIIDEVHMLTKEAFNALLKTLEEPPAHVKFMFATTEPERVLPTILSRCQRFDLRRIPSVLIVQHLARIATLEKVTITPAALHAIARGADGGMRDAESTLDQLISFCGEKIEEADVLSMFGLAAQEQLLDLAGMLLRGEALDALRRLDELARNGKDLGRLLGDLLNHFRNLLVFQASGGDLGLLEVSEAEAAALKTQAGQVTTEALTRILEVLADADYRLRDAASKQILLEITLLKVVEARQAVSLDAVLKTLHQLRQHGDSQAATEPARLPAAPRRAPADSAPMALAEPPSAAPVPAYTAAAPAAPKPAPGSQSDSLWALWTALMESVKRASPFLHSYLAAAQPVSFNDKVLTIGFSPEFADYVGLVDNARNQELLQNKLRELDQPGVHVKFVKTSPAAPPAPPTGSPAAPTPAPTASPASASVAPPAPTPPPPRAGAGPASLSQEDFENDPLIQKALEIFRGRLIKPHS